VTFAALPWLLEIAPQDGEGFTDTQLFLSHVVSCAWTEGKVEGLSPRIGDHHHSWLPEGEWLRDEDQPALQQLLGWFTDNCARLAENCLNLVGPDLLVSAYALQGFAILNGGPVVAGALQMLANGEDLEFIHQELGRYGEGDNRAVARLYPLIKQRNPVIASFILEYPGCSQVPEDPRQFQLL
jgi:hypothetical protein